MCRNEGINTPKSREDLLIDIQLAVFPNIHRAWLSNSTLRNSLSARELLLQLPRQQPSFEVWEKVDSTLSDVLTLAEQKPTLLNGVVNTFVLLETYRQSHWPFVCLFLTSADILQLGSLSDLLMHFREKGMFTETTFSDVFKFLCRFSHSLLMVKDRLDKASLSHTPEADRFWQLIIHTRAHTNREILDALQRLLFSHLELNTLTNLQLASVCDLIEAEVSRGLAEKEDDDKVTKRVFIALRNRTRLVQTLELFNLTPQESEFYAASQNAIKLRILCELGFSFEMMRCFDTDFLETAFDNISASNVAVLKYFLDRGISLVEISNHFLCVKPVMLALSKAYKALAEIHMLSLLDGFCDVLLLSRTPEGHFIDDNIGRIVLEFQKAVASFNFLSMPDETKRLYQERRDKLIVVSQLMPLVEFSRFGHRFQEDVLVRLNNDNFILLQHLKLHTTRFKFLLLLPCLMEEIDKVAALLKKYHALQTFAMAGGRENPVLDWLTDSLSAIDDTQCTVAMVRACLNSFYNKLAAFDFPVTVLAREIADTIRLDVPNFLEMLEESETSFVAFLHRPLGYQYAFALRNPQNNIITGHLYHHLLERFPAVCDRLWSLISNTFTLVALNKIIRSLEHYSEDPLSERFLSQLTNALLQLPSLSVDAILSVLEAIHTAIINFSCLSRTAEERAILEEHREVLLLVARLGVPLSTFVPNFLVLSAEEKRLFSSSFLEGLLPRYFLSALTVQGVKTDVMVRVFLQPNSLHWLKQLCSILSRLRDDEDLCPILNRIAKQVATLGTDITRVLNYLKVCTEGLCKLQRLKSQRLLLGIGLERWMVLATEGRTTFNAFVDLIDRSNMLLLQTLYQTLPPFVFYLILFNALPIIHVMLKHYADRLAEDADFTTPQHTVAHLLTTFSWQPVREQTPVIVRGCLFRLCQQNDIPLPQSLQSGAQPAVAKP